ncbi:hypothetical protein BU16DRAFT_181289 [Lophium mytilinum]|uniref:Heterokaryon incompatibility domain-containing protein n=1 Tax=Lophium mytilinum TaxID=390894 RepID=A0A6A6QB85_9PEZI|nr:hypothetical protein BU16DRAFT_181289 [Lophium mytilinum]
MDDAPVNKRAWCLQERELSPRLIQFTSRQFVWRCNCIRTSEVELYHECWDNVLPEIKVSELSKRLPAVLSYYTRAVRHRVGPGVLPWGMSKDEKREALYEYWYGIVEEYSQRLISNPDDRLPALQGLSVRLTSLLEDCYLSGLWERNVHKGLF